MARTEPKDWAKFCKLVKSYSFDDFDFHDSTTVGQVNRFRARYSLVSDLSSITVDNCNSDTSEGYAELMKIVMAWGTVESFFKLKGININSDSARTNHLKPLYDSALEAGLRTELNNAQYMKFFAVVRDECTNNNHKNAINSYLTNPNGHYELSYIMSGIRHVFAHGILTPHSGGVKPVRVQEICNKLTTFFLPIVDKEFAKIVQDHPDYPLV
ncbi:hypothetical protein [Vibrio bivalvicida]|uniref:RiboL-PSP-HEPN domain-containing protein n=1 Tax=Vibrio bivalvicida TaxID=1276888 RepID=A0ABV4MII2_9VIBR